MPNIQIHIKTHNKISALLFALKILILNNLALECKTFKIKINLKIIINIGYNKIRLKRYKALLKPNEF
jgi:hypothetical protein